MNNTIKEYTNNLCGKKWHEEKRFKQTIEFYGSSDKNKAKTVMNMSSLTLSTWIKTITGHNNLSYFQSKTNPEIEAVDYAMAHSKQYITFFKVPPQGGVREVRGRIHRPHQELGRDYLDHACIQPPSTSLYDQL